LSHFEDDTSDPTMRDDIFKKVVGEDKNGYAKTSGIGIKVPHSHTKNVLRRTSEVKESKSS